LGLDRFGLIFFEAGVFNVLTSRRRFIGLGGWSLVAGLLPQAVQAKSIQVNGWFRVEQLQGEVIYRRTAQKTPLKAWLGQKISQVGEMLETGQDGKALLALDSGWGDLAVESSTRWMVKALYRNRAGGRITQLQVLKGQVHLKLRPMVNPSSRFEIQTPLGITGVRGTEFGVVVQPSGQTGIATLSGEVEVSALGKTVVVGPNSQVWLVPNLPPQSPQPLRNDPDLKMELAERGEKEIRLVGVTDPVNLLLINGVPYDTGPTGAFEIVYPLNFEIVYPLVGIGDPRVIVLRSITPLGAQRTYEIPIF
jgi:hypothetical protein